VTLAATRDSRRPFFGPKIWSRQSLLGFLLVILLGGALGAASSVPSTVRLAVVGVLFALVAAVAIYAPRALIVGTLVWLVSLGLLRRYVSGVTATTTKDPLLLVAPLAVALLVFLAYRQGAFNDRSRLSIAVFLLSALMLASTVNPLQGSPLAGISGLLFSLVPVMWFWVARAFVDDTLLRRILLFIGGAGVIVAVYGLSQTLSGFSSVDKRWLAIQGYTALRVGGTVRAFGPFVAASDYSTYLGVAVITLVGLAGRRSRTILALAGLAVVGWALALSSTRTVVVLVFVGLGMMLAARRGMGFARAALLGLGLFACVAIALSHINPAKTFKDPRTADLLTHQVKGLSNPFDQRSSTASGHLGLASIGLQSALTNPLGRGVSTMSLAATKFGGQSFGTETDASNIAVGLGIPGLATYLAIVVIAFRQAHDRAKTRRDVLSLVALGILAATFLNWFTGGNYAVAPLPWLVLGWLDRPSRDRDDVAEVTSPA
jgi:hypothetical protein